MEQDADTLQGAVLLVDEGVGGIGLELKLPVQLLRDLPGVLLQARGQLQQFTVTHMGTSVPPPNKKAPLAAMITQPQEAHKGIFLLPALEPGLFFK